MFFPRSEICVPAAKIYFAPARDPLVPSGKILIVQDAYGFIDFLVVEIC